ncbi:fungal-specific transcription factor domain-containing protein [Xylariaceae sp. FL0255]|nr:fungal-specific transcription factor domain-containing protein [Xylariaceae sp. FL0255]
MMETVRRTQGCWTCKKRKIGCDRGFPACNNCLRTGRECLGYSIRLAWPDQPDGRRRGSQIPDQVIHHSESRPLHYGKQFLNMTYTDLKRAGTRPIAFNQLILHDREVRPSRAISLLPDIHERESHLMNYYNDTLSQMISTINVNNGFREDLIPMAMSTLGKASHGLRNAIYAVAAFHRWGPEHALPYKTEAIRSLSSSLSTESRGTTEIQLATSMMLCVYNVFDETEGNWSLHLYGAQKILAQLATFHGGHLSYSFLYTWFLYHEILGGFSQPFMQWPHGPASLRLLHDSNFDTSLIIGALGCSVEVMEVISKVNVWRAMILHGDPSLFSDHERSDELNRLERQVASLTQRLDPEHESSLSRDQRIATLATAELYRIATFLYLENICNPEPSPEMRSAYLQQALGIINTLEVCTSPWPLFIIACETETDEQRISVLKTLDLMDDKRHIGNVFVLRQIIESFWKQQDLQADTRRMANPQWWDTLDIHLSTPWFI